ncbi:pyr operon leader peptide, partial [Pseudomonas juntendi]|uniref:pyr operon leader peptide n=1 Tax=Pseudomonas juntendi TaxID=2666183 RepID=UPI0034D5FBEF
MVQCVRHFVLPRLKSDAGLPFFFPMLNLIPEPLNCFLLYTSTRPRDLSTTSM